MITVRINYLINAIFFLTSCTLIANNAIADDSSSNKRICTKTARLLNNSCAFEVNEENLSNLAICVNISDRDKRRECRNETRQTQRESRRDCREVFRARKSLCRTIGEDAYEPPFGEEFVSDFVDPLEIGKSVMPNPYFPLVTGNNWVYEGKTVDEEGEEETETITVTVTDQTKLIDGITCVTVIDVAEVNEKIVEITDDWYTQDVSGNVWYCGEIAENFENFDGDDPETPELTDIDGSWKAGRNGAKAGILLPFAPVVGDVIRQEVAWGEAEDVIEILATDGTEIAPAESCNGNCLVTYDFTPLDSDANENKYYAPGIGLIVEIDLNTDDRVELIEFTNSPPE